MVKRSLLVSMSVLQWGWACSSILVVPRRSSRGLLCDQGRKLQVGLAFHPLGGRHIGDLQNDREDNQNPGDHGVGAVGWTQSQVDQATTRLTELAMAAILDQINSFSDS